MFRSLGLGLWSAEISPAPGPDEDPGLSVLVLASERLGMNVVAAVKDVSAPGRGFLAADCGSEPCEMELVQLGCELTALTEAAKGDCILEERLEMLRRYV